jgi:hypothetical protein
MNSALQRHQGYQMTMAWNANEHIDFDDEAGVSICLKNTLGDEAALQVRGEGFWKQAAGDPVIR